MASFPGASIAYGVDLYAEGWQVENVNGEDGEPDWDYVPPWEEGADESDDADAEKTFLTYLLKRLPENPCGPEIDDEGVYELNRLLKERTGLHLVSYAREGSNFFLASGPEMRVYAYDVVDLDTAPVPSEEHMKRLSWAMETAGVTFNSTPGLKIMLSYG